MLATRSAFNGNNDLIDAALAALRLLSGSGLSSPRGGGRREQLRVLLVERRGATQARTAALNQLHSLVVTAPDALRARLTGLSNARLVETATGLRSSRDGVCEVLRRIAKRVYCRSQEIAEIERSLLRLVNELAADLLAECGVGAVCAAQLLVSSADPKRMTSEAPFAALAGASPVDASSGKQQRHRLNRGGDRQLTGALHVSRCSASAITPRRGITTDACWPCTCAPSSSWTRSRWPQRSANRRLD